MNFEGACFHPFTILIISTLLGNFANVYFRIKVSSESLMMVACITIYDIEVMHFVEIMFGGISSKHASSTRVETAT